MKTILGHNKVYSPSKDIVAREIQGEFIIIPISLGKGQSEDDIFSLNETAKKIWNKLDGKKSLSSITKELATEFQGTTKDIEKDVSGTIKEWLKMKMIVESKKTKH